ncbi:MAG: hypothetical protein HYR48_01355 [Gemmatimonadetes bacterium]|nr:hypothetical protein [Gemmatimonadota bacterium]
MKVQRTDLYVGVFLLGTVALVVAALVATSGWGVKRYDVYVRTDDAKDITLDTKIFMQGLEVGRVAAISPRPAPGAAGRLEFILRLSLLDAFPDGTPLRLPRGTDAEVESALFGGSTVLLAVHSESGGTLAPGDTIDMHRQPAAMQAFGALATDLKGTIQEALVAATGTLEATRRLADSLTIATGAARRFMVGIEPGTEKIMAGVAVNLDRLRLIMDSTNSRTAITFREVDATIVQSRRLLVSVDSLTRLLVAMGGENRPEVAAMIVNLRQLSQQLQFVLEQVGRRPMRLITGVKLPDTLSVSRRDTSRARAAPRDTTAATARPDSARPAASRDTTRRPQERR